MADGMDVEDENESDGYEGELDDEVCKGEEE